MKIGQSNKSSAVDLFFFFFAKKEAGYAALECKHQNNIHTYNKLSNH